MVRPNDPLPRPAEKAYRLRAPVEKQGAVAEVGDEVNKTKVAIELGTLWGLAPELAAYHKKQITRVRRPIEKPVPEQDAMLQDGAFSFLNEEVPPRLEYDAIDIGELPSIDCMYLSTEEDIGVPTGSIIVPDPYMMYLASLAPGEKPKQVYAARDSASLRVIFPRVAGMQKVEAVTDSGSQIVSMAQSIAEKLMIPWDPDVQILMQSANGQLKRSAGLARNVAFLFDSITVYLQVHIIDQPAYEVLLGRPFEILTESVVQNRLDGSQLITIRDPNTKNRCTMPTHARGTYSMANQPKPLPKATVEEVEDEESVPVKEKPDTKGNAENVGPDFQQSSMN